MNRSYHQSHKYPLLYGLPQGWYSWELPWEFQRVQPQHPVQRRLLLVVLAVLAVLAVLVVLAVWIVLVAPELTVLPVVPVQKQVHFENAQLFPPLQELSACSYGRFEEHGKHNCAKRDHPMHYDEMEGIRKLIFVFELDRNAPFVNMYLVL